MLNTRDITPNDIDLICAHRHAMFAASGKPREDELAQMAAPFQEWLMPKLSNGIYFGFVTETATTPIVSIGLMALDWPPPPATSQFRSPRLCTEYVCGTRISGARHCA